MSDVSELPQPDHYDNLWPGRRLISKQSVLMAFATMMAVATGYVGLNAWLAHRSLSHQNVQAGTTGTAHPGATVLGTGQQPSETPPAKNALASYQVAGPNPRVLYINKIGLAARVFPMSVNRDGSLQAPATIFDTGWYIGSAKPGEAGAVLVDGHSSGVTDKGAFGRLAELAVGDIARIETGNGKKYDYKVVATENIAKDKLDMQRALTPHGGAAQGLNFITCTGTWLKAEKTMADRLVVYAVRV